MANLGTCTTLRSGGVKNVDGSSIDPIYQAYVQETGDNTLTPLVGCTRAIHDNERYLNSLKKCDKPRVPRPDDLLWDLALQYTRRMFDYQTCSNFSLVYDINMSTSVGKPYSAMGFKSKAELLASPDFADEVKRCHTPIWSVFPKDEYLPLDDVANGKLRTIFNPELPFLLHQKFYFDEQNHRMKKYAHSYSKHWPRYGFVKQYGGFNRMCLEHQRAFKHPIHFTVDVSGYDRDVCLKEVYDDRTLFLFGLTYEEMIKVEAVLSDKEPRLSPMVDTFRDHYKFVVENTLEPVCCLSDGTMFRRPDGNSSGSNDTTVDNCWSHTQIQFYFFLTLGAINLDKILTYEEIMDHVRDSIYGDDILGTIDEPFWYPNGFNREHFEETMRLTYALLRLTIKDKAFKISKDLEGLEFLGSTARWNSFYSAWVPQPRIEKLSTSITQVMKAKTFDVIASSITTFQMLVALGETPEEKIVQEFLKNYSLWLLQNHRDKFTSDSDIWTLISIRDGKYRAANAVLGLESRQGTTVNGFSFFSHDPYIHRSEVGFKNTMLYTQHKQPRKANGQTNAKCVQPPKVKSTWLMTENDFVPPGYEKSPDTTAFAAGIPGGSAFIAGNWISFINEYKQGGASKGLPPIDDITYHSEMSGFSHIPTWECKARFVHAGKVFKTIQRHTAKKDAQQACARMIALYVMHRAHKKNKLTNEDVMKCDQFKLFWALCRDRFQVLSNLCLDKTIIDCYLSEDGQDLFQDIIEGKFDGYREDPQFKIPPKKAKGWRRDLSLDGDVEENPGPIPLCRLRLRPWVTKVVQRRNSLCYPLLQLSGDVELNPGPLTKAQFLSKHKIKYDKAGLTVAQRNQRYAQYVSATKGQAVKPARKQRTRQAKNSYINEVFNSGRDEVSRDQISSSMRQLPMNSHVVMSPCAKLYAVGMVNPFSFFDTTNARQNAVMGMGDIPDGLPCVPSFPSLKSRRTKYFGRGTFVAGNLGNGVVAFAPRRLASDYSLLNNNQAPLILYNNPSGDPGTLFPPLDTGAGIAAGYVAYNGNSDYTSAELSNIATLERLVCAGVRIRYAGPDLSRSGIIHAAYTPSHTSLSNVTLATISQYETYFRLPVSKKWFTLTYTPVLPGEYQYDVDYIQSGTGEDNILNEANSHFMGMLMTGVPVGSLFEYEFCHIMEVVGPNIRDLKLADSDIRGLEMVNNVVRPETQMAANVDGVGRVLSNVLRAAGGLTAITAGTKAAGNAALRYATLTAARTAPLLLR